jgi:hypothetical protein
MGFLADAAVRFLIGGVVVSAFSIAGSLFKPASFAGLFAGAPSVALATLGLAIAKEGKLYVSTERRSMIAGAVALCAYSYLVCWLLMRLTRSALSATAIEHRPADGPGILGKQGRGRDQEVDDSS